MAPSGVPDPAGRLVNRKVDHVPRHRGRATGLSRLRGLSRPREKSKKRLLELKCAENAENVRTLNLWMALADSTHVQTHKSNLTTHVEQHKISLNAMCILEAMYMKRCVRVFKNIESYKNLFKSSQVF